MDKLIFNAISKYMNVFVKNWSTNAFSLSLMKGEGKLSNLQLKEIVIQEIIDLPMLKVTRGTINELIVKLPPLTRLKSDPILLKIDKFELELEEPIEAIQIGTTFRDFMNGMSKKSATSKYKFSDKVIDGLTVQINSIVISIKPLGWFPSLDYGPWTPPTLRFSLSNFTLETTNRLWRVVSLKESLPQFNKSIKSFFVHRKGSIRNVKIELFHEQPDPDKGFVFYDWKPSHIILMDKISSQLKITQRKTMLGGILLGFHCDLTIEQCNLKWDQNHLGGLIHWISAMGNAMTRPNLIKAYYDLKREIIKRAPTKLSSLAPSQSTQNLSSEKTSKSSTSKSSALKFVNTSSKVDTEDDYSLYNSESDTEISDDETLKDWETVGNIEGVKENTSGSITYPRFVVNINLNELFIQILDSKEEIGREIVLEMLGFGLNLIRPDDVPSEKHLQIKIPFIQIAERELKELNSRNKLSEMEMNRLLAAEEFSTLFGPRLKFFDEENEYTIPMQIWPEFLSNNRYYPEQKGLPLNGYKPLEAKKRIYFNDGNEMFRMKLMLGQDSYVFENRVNPVQVMLNVPKILRIVDMLFESVPDMDMIPPSTIPIPVYKSTEDLNKSNGIPTASSELSLGTPIDDLDTSFESEEFEKSVTFLFELRQPSVLIPSNSKSGEYDDVSELLKLTAKEIIISSDPHLRKQEWTESSDSLYSTYEFPGSSDDYSKSSKLLFEYLPKKFKFQISKYSMELLPSLSSIGKPFMDPISLDVYLGINSPNINPSFPKIVLMSNIPEIHLKLNQNQAILLIELWRTYADDPPQLTNLFVEHTKSVVKTGRKLHTSKKQSVQDSNLNDSFTIENELKTKGKSNLIAVFFVIHLDKATLTLSSSENDTSSMMDALSYTPGSELCEISFMGTEIAVETNSLSQQLIIKNRVKDITVLSPPSSNQASAISLASVRFPSTYIFPNQKDLSNNIKWVIQARLEYPLNPILLKLSKNKNSENSNFNINPYVKILMNGLHIGVNAQSSYQILRFLESKDNIFDSSPLEIMNTTVKRTFSIVKEKVLKKKQNEQVNNKDQESKSELINNAEDSSLNETTTFNDNQNIDNSVENSEENQISNSDLLVKKQDDNVENTKVNNEINTINQNEKLNEVSQEDLEIAERPEFNDQSIVEVRKLTEVGNKLKATLKSKPKVVNPILVDFELENIELCILEDGILSSAILISGEKIQIKHVPTNTEESKISNMFGRQYSIHSHEFLISLDAKSIQLHTIVPKELTDIESSFQIPVSSHELGDPFSFLITFEGDYNKKITEHEANLKIIPSKNDISIHMNPKLISATSNIIKQQISSLKEFQHILKLLKKPSYDMSFNFQRLKSQISKSQMSLTRALVCHSSLQDAFSEINSELESRDEALQSMIGDKMRLTQMLADSQSFEIQHGVKEETKEDVILMESICAVQKNYQGELKKVYAVLFGNEFLCLSQKVNDLKELFNVKLQIFHMTVDRNATVQKRLTTFGKSKETHELIDIKNGDITLSLMTTNEKHMVDWFRILETCIEDDKMHYEIEERKKYKHEIEIQTEESSFNDSQNNESKKSHTYIKELKDMKLQLESMKETMKIARKDEVILRERLSELSRYVAAVEKEKELKRLQIKNKVAEEAERLRQLEAQREVNKRLQVECTRRQKYIDLVKKKYDELTEAKKRSDEEKVLLQDNFKAHLILVDKEIKFLKDENNRLSFQLNTLNNNNSENQINILKETYQSIILNMEQELLEKNNNITALKQEVVQLRSNSTSTYDSQTLAPPPIKTQNLTPLSPSSPGVDELFTLPEKEMEVLMNDKPTRDTQALLFNTSPRHIVSPTSLEFKHTQSPIVQFQETNISIVNTQTNQSQPPPLSRQSSLTTKSTIYKNQEKIKGKGLFSKIKAEIMSSGIKEKSKNAIQIIDSKVTEAVAYIEEERKKPIQKEISNTLNPIKKTLPPPPKITKKIVPPPISNTNVPNLSITQNNDITIKEQDLSQISKEFIPINILDELDSIDQNKDNKNLSQLTSDLSLNINIETFENIQNSNDNFLQNTFESSTIIIQNQIIQEENNLIYQDTISIDNQES